MLEIESITIDTQQRITATNYFSMSFEGQIVRGIILVQRAFTYQVCSLNSPVGSHEVSHSIKHDDKTLSLDCVRHERLR